ncbi:MYB DNA-binding domain-containing protein [Microsporum canis CBS 113480]|uniref:MYB DNA-binding domain-containing protein n=1 Tax=Arthroderma otae (strain ATCC MYA-4605 / CBS 113480) TaxID=554155 RepID=C5FT67_ARTOC|nr:MYB DNA-binding domain-containing protein [Microsporum canis CBS 113480]EEQ33070.1 MYB DNA-binding domain-containing protein [Microsporum canis CBS 113480]
MGDALEQLSFRVAILHNTSRNTSCTGVRINNTSSINIRSTTRPRSSNLNSRVSQATVQQPVMIPTPMVPPQLPPHFSSTSLPLPYPGDRHGVKRRRADDGRSGGSDDTTPGIGLSMLPETSHADEQHSSEMLLPAPVDHSSHHQHSIQHDYHQTSPIHQQHHHHRLPSQATLAAVQGSDGELTSPGGGTGSQSVVGQPGMPDPAPRPRGPKLKFTPEDDSLLVELKENRNLTWKQIAEFFPGRTSGTLQVRYCTKLRAKATVWTDEAVQRLRNAIQDYENDRWRIVATKVGSGFSPAACREKAAEIPTSNPPPI